MTLEILILKTLLQHSNIYNTYYVYIDKYILHSSINIYTKVFNTIKALKSDSVKPSHTAGELASRFYQLYPILSEAEAKVASQTFEAVASVEVSEEEATKLFARLRERALSTEIALKAVEVSEGKAELSFLKDLIDHASTTDASVQDEKEFVEDDIVQIKARLDAEPPYKFRLKTLNRILGGLRRRTFGFLFARPERGKTQLLSSEVTFLAPQTERGVLWINNEEEGSAIVTRNYQAALGLTSEEVFSRPEHNRGLYFSLTKGKIKLYDNPSAGFRQIERVIKTHSPDIIVIDQLDKVRGFDAERYDLVQKAKYQWAREIAKQHNCAVIGVCQAGGSAENKKYLDMNDVDSSHTAKQGEADWMFGMGSTDQAGYEAVRYISVCKNKLPPCAEMVEGMRHAKVPILSIPEIQRYEDTLGD